MTEKHEYDETDNSDITRPMGRVNPKNPLAGLRHINVLKRDIAILSQEPHEIQDLKWSDVQDIVAKMDLSRFTRRPSDLRNYLRWKHVTERDYSIIDEKTGQRISGVVMYLLIVRLKGCWGNSLPLNAEGRTLFQDVQKDIRILSNDFPYALEDGIVHVVVWSRVRVPVEEIKPEMAHDSNNNNNTNNDNNGELKKALAATTKITDKARTLIQRYVDLNFVEGLGLPKENVLWFKNWAALQSIPAMEHFHVMILNPPIEKLESLYGTGGKQIEITI